MKKILAVMLALLSLMSMLAGCGKTPEATTTTTAEPTQTVQTTVTEPTTAVPTTTQETEPPIPLNPYGPMDFGYEGDYLTCWAGESMTGVDVSFWQGDIDWQKVAESGIEFAIIRLAWRGSEQGLMFADDYAQANYEGATAAGIKVGGYFFSQAISPEEAVEEAQFVLDMVKDWDIQMPLVFDWEYIDDTSRTADVDGETLTACTKAFCDTINAAGYESMVYFNPEQAWRKLDLEALVGYEFWLAMYESTMVYPYKIHMWQYTDQGTVPGIEGPVDLNVYLQYEEG